MLQAADLGEPVWQKALTVNISCVRTIILKYKEDY